MSKKKNEENLSELKWRDFPAILLSEKEIKMST